MNKLQTHHRKTGSLYPYNINIFFMMTVLMLGLRMPIDGQTLSKEQLETKLSAKVSLPPGKTTIAALMISLSKQTGVPIQADAVIQERTIFLHVEELNASQVLDVVADLNDWRWFQTENHTLFITRKRPLPLHSSAELSSAVRSALPADFRRYLSSSAARSHPSTFDDKPMTDLRSLEMPSPFETMVSKYTLTVNQQLQWLFGSVQPDIFSGKPMPYSSLTSQQQQTLVAILVHKAFSNNGPNGTKLMHGSMRLDLLDPSVLEMRLKEGCFLEIGRTAHEIIDGHQAEQFVGGVERITDLQPTVKSP